MKKLTVIDFFCGAGGFSEGFRQMGFEIIYGYDNWKPAIDTYNHNFNLNCNLKNILDFKFSIEEIENLPNTDLIIGSPPCVSFSSSNKSGKADKSKGVELTETFLRIIAVKKHKPNSVLKAWFMENVVNSKRYLQTAYTFKDLDLTEWAIKHRISPLKIAIDLYENSTVINSADYGSYQTRKRVISGEIIKKHKLVIPMPLQSYSNKGDEKQHNSLKKIRDNFPSPFDSKCNRLIKDIQYPITIKQSLITDHFYDTGVYEIEWKLSKYWKVNHPYMGKMSFPENEEKPSRTITATKIANSRESILYKSEINRKGDGEYRLPTVREASIIMGFPITYQFIGTESTKWRLIGNAVCCSVSRAFAGVVLDELEIKKGSNLYICINQNFNGINNLNSYSQKKFDSPPIKNKGSRFRRHPFKEGNMTISLSNFDIEKKSKIVGDWIVTAFYGTGQGFGISKYKENYYKDIEPIILKNFKDGIKFIDIINNKLSKKVASKQLMQEMYEKQKSFDEFMEPSKLVEEVKLIVSTFAKPDEMFIQNGMKIFEKNIVPKKQLYALYALNKISTIANSK